MVSHNFPFSVPGLPFMPILKSFQQNKLSFEWKGNKLFAGTLLTFGIQNGRRSSWIIVSVIWSLLLVIYTTNGGLQRKYILFLWLTPPPQKKTY
jgi:hypothetical protein